MLDIGRQVGGAWMVQGKETDGGKKGGVGAYGDPEDIVRVGREARAAAVLFVAEGFDHYWVLESSYCPYTKTSN